MKAEQMSSNRFLKLLSKTGIDMKIFSLIILFAFFSAGCGEEKKVNDEKLKPMTDSQLSLKTEIKSSVINNVVINTPTIKCKTCEKNILKAFRDKNSVTKVKVNLKSKNVEIDYDQALITVEQLREIISKAGYDADDVKRDPTAYDSLDECCKDDSEHHG